MKHSGVSDPRYVNAIAGLRDARRKVGLSQQDLAKSIGKSQQFISKYESRERRLDMIEFFDIGSALGLSIDQIFDLLRKH